MGRLASQHPVATFFLAAFLVTWAVWVPRALVHQGVVDWGWPLLLGLVWTYGPPLAAVAVTAAFTGRHGSQRLGSAIVRWRVGWRWYALVMLGPFVVSSSALLLHSVLIGPPVASPVQ